MQYNIEHNITPKTIIKPIKNTLQITKKAVKKGKKLSKADKEFEIENLTNLMNIASENLDFETAIKLREEIKLLKGN